MVRMQAAEQRSAQRTVLLLLELFVLGVNSQCVLDTDVNCNGCMVQHGQVRVDQTDTLQCSDAANACGSGWTGVSTGKCVENQWSEIQFQVTKCTCAPAPGPSPVPGPGTLSCNLGGSVSCNGCTVQFDNPVASGNPITKECSASCPGYSGTAIGYCRQSSSMSTKFFPGACTCHNGPPPPPPPPPKPPPAPSPPVSWPTFSSQAALSNDPWGNYFRAVYGALPSTADFPLNLADFWMFYDDTIKSAKVTNIPAVVSNCPKANSPTYMRYVSNDMYQPADTSWSWHPYPYTAFAGNTWVEVGHQQDPWNDETYGAWMLYAKGSGMWFYLGKTISFPEHNDAYTYFNAGGDPNMCKSAAAQNYDSIQFLAHRDADQYKCDALHTGVGPLYMNIEIVGAKLVGTYSCMSISGAPSVIKSGWKGSKTCTCSNSKTKLNCNGVPTAGSSLEESRTGNVSGATANTGDAIV